MREIDTQSNNAPDENGQPFDDGLCQHNPSPTDEILRRGKDAMQRLRRGFDDWMDIAEALQVGRAESMRAAHTNESNGKRYEKAMGEWLLAHSFHVIDKSARNRLLECLKHRTEIGKWRATLTEGERFRFNHPDTVLRKWKAAAVIPDPNASPKKPSAMAKLKELVVRLEEDNHRMRKEIERGGGDLWSKDDRVGDIADIMLAKLTIDKAKRVAETILAKVKEKRATQPKLARQNVEAAASANERKAQYAAEKPRSEMAS